MTEAREIVARMIEESRKARWAGRGEDLDPWELAGMLAALRVPAESDSVPDVVKEWLRSFIAAAEAEA